MQELLGRVRLAAKQGQLGSAWAERAMLKTASAWQPPRWAFSVVAAGAARLWRSFAIARRFYPSLQLVGAPDDAGSGVANNDMFEALVVRSVSPRLHALIHFRVAMRIGAVAAAEQTALVCHKEGWSSEQVGAAAIGYNLRAFSDVERLLLHYADDLTRTPMDIDLATGRELRKHFTNDQLTELAASIAKENFRVRFQTALDMTRSKSQPARPPAMQNSPAPLALEDAELEHSEVGGK